MASGLGLGTLPCQCPLLEGSVVPLPSPHRTPPNLKSHDVGQHSQAFYKLWRLIDCCEHSELTGQSIHPRHTAERYGNLISVHWYFVRRRKLIGESPAHTKIDRAACSVGNTPVQRAGIMINICHTQAPNQTIAWTTSTVDPYSHRQTHSSALSAL